MAGIFRHCPLDWMIIHELHTQVKMSTTWTLDAGCYLQLIVCIPFKSYWIWKANLAWYNLKNKWHSIIVIVGSRLIPY